MRRCSALPARLLALLLTVAAVGGPMKTAALAAPLMTDAQLRLSSPQPLLWPGHGEVLAVRVTSSADSAATVRVTSLTAVVGAASHACGAEHVTTTSYTRTPRAATYTVAPGQAVVVPLLITMRDSGMSQNACQGAVFPLRFSATTEPVG